MQCYTELIASSAVTHATTLPFLSPNSSNLIIVRLSRLQIFEYKQLSCSDSEPSTASSQDGLSPTTPKSAKDGSQTKLVLHSEYTLSGVVTDFAPVKLRHSRSGGKALLLAFRDAKMSLVTWDPAMNSISTVSIHYYEGEGITQNPVLPSISQSSSFLTVDPNDRCAALKFGSRHVAILPFKRRGDHMLESEFDNDFDDMNDTQSLDREGFDIAHNEEGELPYLPSFVVPLTILDPVLHIPHHFAFLHEYREPTFGILFSKRHPSIALLPERQDTLCYAVYSLDLEHRTSTSLASVTGLPYDLCEVVPLRMPVGGALLVGANELVHVDQSGRTVGVAVNYFAQVATSFKTTDQSSLNLRLEGCVVQPLGTSGSDMLIALNDGSLVLISFKLDGRSVSQMNVQIVEKSHVVEPLLSPMSCSSLLPNNHVFFGSIDGDSVLFKWNKKASLVPLKRSISELSDHEDDLIDVDDIDDDDDDLYATKPKAKDVNSVAIAEPLNAEELYLVRQDTLPSLAPIHDFTFGPTSTEHQGDAPQTTSPLDIYVAAGAGEASSIAALSRKISPKMSFKTNHASANGLWATPALKSERSTSNSSISTLTAYDLLHDYLFVSRSGGDSSLPSIEVLSTGTTDLKSQPLVDFDPEGGPTIEISLLAGGTRIVQVLDTEVKTYETLFNLSQIMPIENESGEELKIKAAYFCDPYMLLLREDASVMILAADSVGELDERELPEVIKDQRWISACLYKSHITNNEPAAFLLNDQGGLVILNLDDIAAGPKYIAEDLCHLPQILTSEGNGQHESVKESLCEIIVADIGPYSLSSPYLIARNVHDDLFVFKPFTFPYTDSSSSPLGPNLRWQRVDSIFGDSPVSPDSNLTLPIGSTKLRSLSNVSGYNLVARLGNRPALFVRESSSPLRMLELNTESIVGVASLNCPALSHGFALLDSTGSVHFCELPNGRFGDSGWAVRKVDMGCDTQQIRYHAPQNVFAVGTFNRQGFKLPPDEYHPDLEEEPADLLPQVEQGTVKLLDGNSLKEIDAWRLEENEMITCLEVVEVVISEVTLQRKIVVVVGTAIIMGEDLAQNGHIYIFDVITIVPSPDDPQTNRRLKLILREAVKGAVTAVSEIGTQGLLLVIHGQKSMVRGLKEDGTFLPTAFMDLQCYVSSAKTIPGTGLAIMGDVIKGIWFVGYTEDPYKMILFGKSQSQLEVMVTEFLPFGDQLFIVAVDADGFLHLFEFAPEDPKSVSGQRLLERSSFYLGNTPSRLQRLPEPPSQDGSTNPNTQQVLATTEFGGLWVIVSVPSEGSYRNLHALQNYLTTNLHHPCGLNPRAYRQVETDGFGSRGILDGGLLSRWYGLSTAQRADSANRVGALESDLRRDLQLVGSLGRLGYL